ncbi:MAG: hypothetical protein Q9177_000310 [Variospora cf. flavescens]
MARSSSVKDFPLKSRHVDVDNSRLLQLGSSSITDDKCVRLLYPNVNRLDPSILAGYCSQNPLDTRGISGRSGLTWLHGRVQHRLGWQDTTDCLFWDVLGTAILSQCTLLGVGEAGGQDLVSPFVDEYSSHSIIGRFERTLLCKRQGETHISQMV